MEDDEILDLVDNNDIVIGKIKRGQTLNTTAKNHGFMRKGN